ncbi:MAG: ATP-dependent DNA helicase [Candidatus Uhrbacteria bacterium]|nr:ATP-dependent DNA helicase [Candidatus Uhrbacteria bacterium]
MNQNLLENLNKEQFEAVTHGDGPLMIIAGAGTGKTTAVTQRIAWLIEQGYAKPDEILALTFTEKAAAEMEERVDMLLPIGYVDLWISTFHSFCERVLKTHALEIGIPHEFKLLDEVGALLMVRRNFDNFNLDYYRPRGNPTRFIKALLTHFSRAKDELISPESYLQYVEDLQMNAEAVEGVASNDQESELVERARLGEVANAYHAYQQLLLQKTSLDFADLVNYTIELFKTRPNILKQYRDQFKYILVDEFQDTNAAQYELVKLLSAPKNNLTIVGDDDQSIYKFRGASLENILKFRQDYPNAKQIVLNQNYRSGSEILDKAHSLIQSNNPNRLEARESLNKKLISNTEFKGSVCYRNCVTLEDEVKETLEKILEIKNREQCKWSEFAILVRANDSAEPFIRAMDRAGIPYRFMAMSGLYTKPIVVDALSYLRVIINPHDSPSVYRILSHPRIGIDENDLIAVSHYSHKKGTSLIDSLKASGMIAEISSEGRIRINEILDSLSILASTAKRKPTSELFVEVMKQTGLLADVRLHAEAMQVEFFGHLNQFFDRIKRFEVDNDDKTLFHFLDELSHERDAGEVGALAHDPEAGPDVVNIMTIHGSKGLEFRYVFLVNLVEQRFPSQKRSDAIALPLALLKNKPAEDQHIEEERRLFYVAMTRAKEGLFLYSADDYGGKRKRKPSRFIKELRIESSAKKSDDNSIANAIETSTTIKTPINTIDYSLPKSFSFTQLAAFSTCPLQYKFAHILKVPVFGRHMLSFGKSMHNTLQQFMELVLAGQTSAQTSLFDTENPTETPLPSAKDLLDLYEALWIDEWYPNQDIKTEYFEKGKKSLLEYHAMLKADRPLINGLEKGFTLKIGEVVVRGRIDRIDNIDGGVEIIDYKTGNPTEQSKLGWDKKKQLVLYNIAAENCFDPPLKVKKLTYHFLEDNSTVSFEATEKDVERLKDEILSTVADIKSSSFKATPGFHCQYCDFKDICEFSQV